jgi:aminopeptidase YwaD
MGKSYGEYAREALELTADIIHRHGPRVSGTEGCRGARAELGKILGGYCSSVRLEAFRIHPASLFAIGKIFAATYLIGLASLLIGGGLCLGFGLASMVIACAYFATQFILYLDVFDGLFAGAEAENIVGTIDPSGPVARQVLIVGHHDSSYVYPFYEKHPSLYPIRLLIPIALFLSCLAALILGFAASLALGAPSPIALWMKCVLLAGAIPVAPMYRFISNRGSPGAGDNLIGCAIGIKLAEAFSGPSGALQGTRVIVLLSDGEEVGQKGAKAFIEKNRALLAGLDTLAINVDSIYEYEDIAILRRDRNGMTGLSKSLAGKIGATAKRLGHEFKSASIPFLGGGTDGGQFARAGMATASIIGLPIGARRDEILMHTMRDLPERIAERAVAAVIEVICEYVKGADASAGEGWA